MTDIVNLECEKTLAGLAHLSKDDAESIRRMTRAIASRAIHDPILFLRNTGDHRDDSLYLNIARQLFNLDIPDHNY
jgi:glutamyl-tRNA reductase